MIAGTFVLEEHTIQFRARGDGRVEYTVQDARSGTAATKNVSTSEFSAALHIVLVGDVGADEPMYALAEDAMPELHDALGGIP